MAKSKKTVEIPLVRSGAAVESGDVNFTFNNELIGSLSESGTAVLKTKDTIVRKDIEVEYTKPETPVGLVIPSTITIENESEGFNGIYSTTNAIIYSNTLSHTTNYVDGDVDQKWAVGYIPTYHDRQFNYSISFNVSVDGGNDTLNVLVNGVPLNFNDGAYTYSAIFPATQIVPALLISITDKQ